MATETFDTGDRERFKATFKDATGALANPTLTVATLREPDGTITTPTTNNLSTGIKAVDITFTQTGRHFLRFTGTGAVVSSQGIEFYVKKRNAI